MQLEDYCEHLYDDSTDGYLHIAHLDENRKVKIYSTDDANVRKIVEEIGQEDVFITTARNSKNDIQTKIEFNKINLPLKAGDVVGKIYIIEDGIIVKEINIISNKDHLKQSYFDCIKNITSNWR